MIRRRNLEEFSYCEMLLIQASEVNSKTSQAYKIGNFAKIVNSSKLILKFV